MVFATETVNMLDPAAPSVKKGSRSAAKSRTVNRDLTCDQYGMCRLRLGQLVHTHTIPLPNITSPQTGIWEGSLALVPIRKRKRCFAYRKPSRQTRCDSRSPFSAPATFLRTSGDTILIEIFKYGGMRRSAELSDLVRYRKGRPILIS